ncbi:AAA-like domain-containing protein [Okeania sp. SIO3I5]|uniref:WD40 domain-containing protein n=1 Tax=Okeania sp. SIO3I5 TaxID=2607805 RepID=UPI0025E8F502|nr:AAA-like domain-containing protein [Okeania sp. SIO3I5]
MNNYEYYIGGSLPIHATTYVTRLADNDLYEGLKNGDFCYVLNSRQMGKSSLRVKTIQRLQQENIACVSIDMTEIGTDDITPSEWYASIIDTILTGLNLDDDFDIEELWEANSQLSNVKRFSKFIGEILLPSIEQQIVIFIDEIDSTLSLPFNIDDFFAVVRDCYNKRADNSDYQRLTFAMIGVATPADLIKEKKRTPFNIGKPIKLSGFRLAEVEPLAKGLVEKTTNINKLMEAVLDWTGGQPFLTQKLCKLISNSPEIVPDGQEAEWVADLVKQRIIDNWQVHDDPEHLKTIRDRLLVNEKRASRLLGLYQQIIPLPSPLERGRPEEIPLPSPLERGRPEEIPLPSPLERGRLEEIPLPSPLERGRLEEIPLPSPLERGRPETEEKKPPLSKGGLGGILTDDNHDQMELRLTGLVVKEEGRLEVANRIYQEVFNLQWVEKELGKLRPYSEAFTAWEESGCNDESRLLRGQALADALAWSVDKSLSDRDYQFLAAAQEQEKQAIELEKLEAQVKLDAQAKANQILNEAKRKAEKRLRISFAVLVLSFIGASITGVTFWRANLKLAEAEAVRKSITAQLLFESNKYWTAMLQALRAAKQLPKSNLIFQPQADSKMQVTDALSQAIYRIDSGKYREINRLQGHEDAVWGLAFSADGQMIATASGDNTVKLWNHQGQLLQTLEGHENWVWGVAVSPDGETIASASRDKTVKLWNRQGQLLHTLTGHESSVWDVAFSPNGETIATASGDETVKLWDSEGKLLHTLTGHESSVFSVAFSPDGETIASASADKTVKLWDSEGKLLQTLTGHEYAVWGIAFSPDGQMIASASDDNTVKLWDSEGKLLHTLTGHESSVFSVAFSSDSQMIATASDDKTVKLWNRQGQLLQILTDHEYSVNGVAFSPNGETLTTASDDKTVKLWNRQGQLLQTLTGHEKLVNGVEFSPDGKMIATASADETVKLWNRQGKLLQTLAGHYDAVLDVAFSPDGETIATASGDRSVMLWNLQGQVLQTLTDRGFVFGVAFSRDGETIATASDYKTVKLWNLKGQLLQTLKGHEDGVNAVVFSPDGETIATASDDHTVKLWNRQGKLLQTLKGHEHWVFGVAFSPDGETIASASRDDTVKLWNQQGQLLRTLTGHENIVYDVAFSPNGETISTVSGDETVKLWNQQGQLLQTLTGHENIVYDVAFSPDGETIATASRDNTVKLWNGWKFDRLHEWGCNWMRDYLENNPNVSESDKRLCDRVGN